MTSIANTIRAARAQGAHNPFGVALATPHLDGIDMSTKPQTKLAPPRRIEPEDLMICDDPLLEKPRVVGSKYAAKFDAMKMGQALIVPGRQTGHVAHAMRKWIKAKGLDAHPRTIAVYPGCPKGLGRVWLMKGPQDAAVFVGQQRAKSAANTSMAQAA